MQLGRRVLAVFLFIGLVSSAAYSESFQHHFNDSFDKAEQTDFSMVPSDATSLLNLYHDTYGVDKNILDDIFGYLGCVVSNLELPEEVYINCGLAIVETVGRCSGGFSPSCLEGVVGTATQCVAPIESIVEAVGKCNGGAVVEEEEGEVDTELPVEEDEVEAEIPAEEDEVEAETPEK